MKGVIAMYDYKWKKAGVAISAVGLLGMIVERTKGLIILQKYSAAQHYAMFEWVMMLGLFTIIYCREKEEDDRAKAIRAKSFQVSFLLVIGTMLAIALTSAMHPDKDPLAPADLFFLSAFGLIFYLFFFNIGLYFDFLWDYEDRGVWENLRNIGKNKWGMLVYLAGSTIILLLLTLLY
jgi:cation transport ATPase